MLASTDLRLMRAQLQANSDILCASEELCTLFQLVGHAEAFGMCLQPTQLDSRSKKVQLVYSHSDSHESDHEPR